MISQLLFLFALGYYIVAEFGPEHHKHDNYCRALWFLGLSIWIAQ